MRHESPPNNQNLQLKLVKSPIGQANPKSVTNISKIYNKNNKFKDNHLSKFKDDVNETVGKI